MPPPDPPSPMATLALARPRAALLLVALAAGAAPPEPPTEFRLFRFGKNETTKGTFVLTPADAQACLARHRAYGNDLSIDYGHGVLEESAGEPQRAAGWIGGLEVRADGLWAIRVTWTETAAAMIRAREQRFYSPLFGVSKGHITEIVNVALTLTPATCNLTPLVASRVRGLTPKATSMNLKNCSKAQLTKLAEDAERLAAAEGATDECKAMAAAMRKLADEATDDEPTGEQEAASRILAAAREVTGLTDPGEVLGALEALGEAHSPVALEAEKVRARVTELVKLAAAPGPGCKVSPAEVPSLIEKGIADEAWLRGYLKVKSPLPASGASLQPGAGPGPGGAPVALSAVEDEVRRRAGISVEDWNKHKNPG